jgi:site-specific DNA-adenine methylase
MFSYYGSKTKLIHLYPAPTHDTIIEPFAGAAAYAMQHWQKQVILYDAYPKVAAVWQYLIDASEADILALPDLKPGDKVTDFTLSDPERWLIGFSINRGSSVPKVTASQRSDGLTYKKYIRENLHKVKHWKVVSASYEDCPNQAATWFVDPPYQKAGKYYYGYTRMDYVKLGAWCKSLQGQVIVCENEGADWLPFEKLTLFHGSTKTQTEMLYLQEAGSQVQTVQPEQSVPDQSASQQS